MAAEEAKQYIVIKLGNDSYGIEIKYIESIIVMQRITRVPKSQQYFKGVINLRGEVVPVLSLRKRIGLEEVENTPATRIIIVRPEEQAAPFGIIVDEVREVITLTNDDIDRLSFDDSKVNFSLGIGKYDNQLINILNITAMVEMDKSN